jgi:Zn-dependent protease with chaperone function
MTNLDDLYPPGPEGLPADIARPTPGYRFQVVVVLASLFLFVALYLALIAASAYWAYWSFSQLGSAPSMRGRGGRSSDPALWYIVSGVAAVLLCLFLVKSLFKRSRFDQTFDVEIFERDQPLLFAFLRRLCQETNAPFPHRVFVNFQVNAAVFYHQSFLSLFLPTPKNLLIGLGLVNRLNLSEIKAVLAHEFGHFSQSSMKLGTYVYTSNRIIADLVYGRDWLDDILDQAKYIDLRIAIFIWAFLGVLWLIRKVLEGIFKAINFANSALMRQMEFNADLVAYRAAGSDAIVHSLAKLQFADEALGAASRELFHAGDHQLYTRDLFYHQTKMIDYLRKQSKDPRRGEPPPLPDDPGLPDQIFQPGDLGIPLMWASHPSNFDRERNVKARYIRCPIDVRSAWLLFTDAEALREQVTRKYYAAVCKLPDVTLGPPETVQAFLDAEHQETTYDERYHGIYDEGFIGPGDLGPLMAEADAEFGNAAVLAGAQANLFNDGVKARMEQVREHRKEYGKIHGLVNGYVKDKTFFVDKTEYPAKRAREFLPQVKEELDADQKWLDAFDRSVFKVHYAMAKQLGPAPTNELLARYKFHLAAQLSLTNFQSGLDHLQATVNQFAGQRNIEQNQFQGILQSLRENQEFFVEKLREANALRLPSLKNMDAGESLGEFLWSKPLPHALPAGAQSIDGAWISTLAAAFGEVIDKSRRIHLKSMGGLLTCQEEIAQRWRGVKPEQN